MSKKMEKLREVNLLLNNLLAEMETRIFVENINIDNIKEKSKEEKPVIIVEPKQ